MARIEIIGPLTGGSRMAKIRKQGYLIVGVDQNTMLLGYFNPAHKEMEGFEVEIAREIALAIFGDRNRVQRACYRAFLSGLLDITDNLVDGAVRPPADVLRYDGDDPYLVVAADKGTATFADLGNQISADYEFWLGDAFASGGSVGYDSTRNSESPPRARGSRPNGTLPASAWTLSAIRLPSWESETCRATSSVTVCSAPRRSS